MATGKGAISFNLQGEGWSIFEINNFLQTRPDVAGGKVGHTRPTCHPEGEFKPLLFSHSWTTQGPESTLLY